MRAYKQWCDEDEELFLDCLAASCNVLLACEQADVAPTTVYRQRRRRADFKKKWQEALEQGYARLEMALVAAAADSVERVEFDAERPIPQMSAETAIKVLQLHRASVAGVGRRSGYRAPPKRLEEVQASILRKIEAIRHARNNVNDQPDDA